MNDELSILWTNDNPITTEKMVFLYGHNAKKKGWWKEVTVIVWGATAQLAADDPAIQARIKEMIADGVRFSACKACSDQLGVTETLESLGIETKYWGQPLTELIRGGAPLLTL